MEPPKVRLSHLETWEKEILLLFFFLPLFLMFWVGCYWERRRGLFEGFLVDRNRTTMSYSQFADDNIFFSKASMEDLQTLKLILLVVGCLLGLRINLNKSTLSSINTSQNQISRLAMMLECTVFDWPLMYLGLPLGGNHKSSMF